MFHFQLLLGTGVITVIVLFHVATLFGMHKLLHSSAYRNHVPQTTVWTILIIGLVVIAIIGIHTTEAWCWAVIYMWVGEFKELEEALYFSVVTATTLGFGDVTISPKWRLLSAFEAMGGLLFFSLSTAFLIGYIQELLFPNLRFQVNQIKTLHPDE